MKKLSLFMLLLSICSGGFGQYSRYVIQLKNKTGTPYSIGNPSQFLTQRAINRRSRYHIPVDETDLPVTPAYIDSIRLSGDVTILNTSKWLNQICIRTTDAAALNKINSYSFVIKSLPVGARQQSIILPINKKQDAPDDLPSSVLAKPLSPADVFNYGVAYPQVSLHNAEFLHNQGFRGQGMQLAIMDAGFYHYKSLPTFDSIRINNQILGTWDFVANEESVDEDYVHGMSCLSTIAANLPGSFVGTSPKASFYLFRAEDVSGESPVEEQNWVAAAEKADSLGADVFSVSLGYNLFDNSIFNYTYADMDGNTTTIAKAANLAAKKGILMVAAAGNDGNSAWKYITTPGDADSVLTVGAVNAARQVAAFSSYGPSSDGQIKPDVAAIGQNAVIANSATGEPTYGSGTSYACPIMAGIVTCLWQAFPEVNNMNIIQTMRQASDRWDAPDNRIGYGIPDAKKAFVLLIKKLYTQQISLQDSCKTRVSVTVKAGENMSVVIERKLTTDIDYRSITAFNFTGDFTSRNLNYSDDLKALAGGGEIKYRLKMTIGSDTSFYLDSTAINYTATCGNSTVAESITISPNPVTDQLLLQVVKNQTAKLNVIVHSISGQKIYSHTQSVIGAQQLFIPMKQLSRGIYLVTIFINDKKEFVKKIIKE